MSMKFNLEELNPGVFFPFDEDKVDEGGITIRLATPALMNKINKKTVKTEYKVVKGQKFEASIEDEEKRQEMLWDYTIVSWSGVEDMEGDPIECSTINKIKLMRESTTLINFVSKAVEKLNEDSEDIAADLEKN